MKIALINTVTRILLRSARFVKLLFNSSVHAFFRLFLVREGSSVFDHTLNCHFFLFCPTLMIAFPSIVSIVIYVLLPNPSLMHGECVLLLCVWKHEGYSLHPTPTPTHPHHRPECTDESILNV